MFYVVDKLALFDTGASKDRSKITYNLEQRKYKPGHPNAILIDNISKVDANAQSDNSIAAK